MSLKILIVLALALRFALMPFTFHPDLAGQAMSVSFFAQKNIVNIYEHLLSLPPTHPLVRNFGVSDIFIYPPLTYFTLGFFQKIFLPFGIGQFVSELMSGLPIYKISNFSLYLLLLKLPYLFFDLGTAYLLYKISKSKTTIVLWLFNPITLYATYCMGVFDIIPVFFTVLSVYFLKQKKSLYAALALGFGVAYKTYPIFLLPFIIFSQKKLVDKIKVVFFGLIPFLATNLPYFFSSAYRYMVFSPKSQKMLYMQFPVSGAEGIYPFIFIFVLLVLICIQKNPKYHNLWKYYLSFFLLLFSVTHYHPQWMLWISPFILIHLITSKYKYFWHYLVLFGIYLFIVFTFENSLSIGLFAPLNPALANYPGIVKIISSKFDIFTIKSIVRSIFAGISTYLIFRLLKSSDSND